MKKLLFILLLFVGLISNAQQARFRRMDSKFRSFINDSSVNKRQMLENFKIKYLTDSLAMSSLEAESFWPIYNEYVKSIKELRSNKTANEIKFEEEVFNLRKDYFKKLSNVFKSEDKANKVLRLDREFMQKLIKRQRNKKDHKRPK